MNKKVLTLSLLASSLLMTGCKETIDDVDHKVVARWEAIINSDYESAYAFLSPSVKLAESLNSYSIRMETAKIHTQWKEVDFVSKDCYEEVCEVNVKIRYVYSFPRKSMGSSEVVTQLTESWINKSGTWYYMPQKQ